MRTFSVYILASPSRRLYIGVTSSLLHRIYRHREGSPRTFTQRYGITRLVYFETTGNPLAAIAREKQLKRWPRWRKLRLIEEHNAGWLDLSEAWLPVEPAPYTAPGNP